MPRRYGRRRPVFRRKRRVTFRRRRFGPRRSFKRRRTSRRPGRPELKQIYVPIGPGGGGGSTVMSTNYSYADVTGTIVPGTNSSTRIGSTVVIRKMQFWADTTPAAATPLVTEFCRWVLVRQGTNVSAPTAFTQIYDTSVQQTTAQIAEFGLRLPGQANYFVIKDTSFKLLKPGDAASTPGTIHKRIKWTIRWRKGLRVNYTGDAGSTFDNRRPNFLYLFALGQQAAGASAPVSNYGFRLWFTDV